MPGALEAIRAVAASAQAIRVTWAAPPPEVRGGRITHYTLYTRELGKYVPILFSPPTKKYGPGTTLMCLWIFV